MNIVMKIRLKNVKVLKSVKIFLI